MDVVDTVYLVQFFDSLLASALASERVRSESSAECRTLKPGGLVGLAGTPSHTHKYLVESPHL